MQRPWPQAACSRPAVPDTACASWPQGCGRPAHGPQLLPKHPLPPEPFPAPVPIVSAHLLHTARDGCCNQPGTHKQTGLHAKP
eukprot:scaffold42419_cov15-Tisochrysis_lutea.AAC.1